MQARPYRLPHATRPYLSSPQTYPLSNRGLRVVSGRNADEPGADSNGSGKTSLVTAPLWALTGDVLSRTEVRHGSCWAVGGMACNAGR